MIISEKETRVPKLAELAKIIRSKNAGPFLICYDIIFDDVRNYRRVKKAAVLTEDLFESMYGVSAEHVHLTHYDAGMGIKASFPRNVAQGSVGDSDIYGCQQAAPLYDVEVE